MIALELFAGCGGAALGIESAGFAHAGLVEIDRDACSTMRAARHKPVVQTDVRNLTRIDLAVRGRPIDLLWSSFPCQAWSVAGQRRGAKDRRNGWPWTVRAVDRYKPRWLLAENVVGLTHHASAGHPSPEACPRCYFETVILGDLRDRFEHVGWWVLNAADYGVPQRRKRVIIWAGPAPLRRPEPTHADPSTLEQAGLFGQKVVPWVSMAEALGVPPESCASTGSHRHGRPVIPVVGPSPTIRANMGKFAAVWTMAGTPFIDGPERRRLTVREAARLQDFPDDYPWRGPIRAQYRQIGNAVPPRLAEVVARAVVEAESLDRELSTGGEV